MCYQPGFIKRRLHINRLQSISLIGKVPAGNFICIFSFNYLFLSQTFSFTILTFKSSNIVLSFPSSDIFKFFSALGRGVHF